MISREFIFGLILGNCLAILVQLAFKDSIIRGFLRQISFVASTSHEDKNYLQEIVQDAESKIRHYANLVLLARASMTDLLKYSLESDIPIDKEAILKTISRIDKEIDSLKELEILKEVKDDEKDKKA